MAAKTGTGGHLSVGLNFTFKHCAAGPPAGARARNGGVNDWLPTGVNGVDNRPPATIPVKQAPDPAY
jgi:hypothetical protein